LRAFINGGLQDLKSDPSVGGGRGLHWEKGERPLKEQSQIRKKVQKEPLAHEERQGKGGVEFFTGGGGGDFFHTKAGAAFQGRKMMKGD